MTRKRAGANVQAAIEYHHRTKHHFQRFARSLGYMDWANQPDPFRRWQGCPLTRLPLGGEDPMLPHAGLYAAQSLQPAPLDTATLGRFLELSMGLSAWKTIPGDAWALRINPSSGNLHPTEAYLLCWGESPEPGLYHYAPREHALERRAPLNEVARKHLCNLYGPDAALLALTSIPWREAWKYGERAFRYCQHDCGHALAALAFAARLLGRRLQLVADCPDARLAALLGFEQTEWPGGEPEHPELLALLTGPESPACPPPPDTELLQALQAMDYAGAPNSLSARHMDWPVIDSVLAKTCFPESGKTITTSPDETPPPGPPPTADSTQTAAALIRQRRSAQHFDGQTGIAREAFLALLDRCLPRPYAAPWEAWPLTARCHLLLFVHRVEGLTPGLYFLCRNPAQLPELQRLGRREFLWRRAAEGLPLYLLAEGDLRRSARDLCCAQDIAGDSAFSLGMIARFRPELETQGAWLYRRLFWESGLIGQVLYIEAEAAGLRGTGIGCYFDDPVHELFGLRDDRYQSLYHFTVGGPLEDSRLSTLPPYHHLEA